MTITAMRLDIETLKRDKNLLLAELGLEREGAHCKCPFHGDSTGSMFVRQDISGSGKWVWRCQTCDKGGTIIDARILRRNLRSPKEAIESLAKDLGMAIHVTPPKPPAPKIKIDAATQFVREAQNNLEDFDVFEEYALGKRGIKNLSTVQRLGLGFVKNYTVYGRWLVTGWVIPIMDLKGVIQCVKFHRESARYPSEPSRAKTIPKCFWLPFGKRQPGQDKAEHGWKTIWPNPEMFGDDVEDYYFHGGELKAAVMIDHRYPAGAPTSGEGGVIHPDDIRRIKAKRIWICYDDEENKRNEDGSEVRNAGHKWCEAHLKAFHLAGFDEVYPITYGDIQLMQQTAKVIYNEQKTAEEAREKESDNFNRNEYARTYAYEEGQNVQRIHEGNRNQNGFTDKSKRNISEMEKSGKEIHDISIPTVQRSADVDAMQAAFDAAANVERMEVVAASDLDALQAAFENSTLIKVPERNPLAPPGMTENYYKKFNAICGNSDYVKPFISAKDLEMLEWMKGEHSLDYRRRVHPDHVRMIAVNSASHAEFMQRRMLGGYSFANALNYNGETWDRHTCPPLKIDYVRIWEEVNNKPFA